MAHHASHLQQRRAHVLRELVTELEERFPYAAATSTTLGGLQINDNGTEQSASEGNPSSGAVFTVYDGAGFNEYATGEQSPDSLVRAVRNWASDLFPRSGGPALARDALESYGPAEGERQVFHTEQRIDPASVPLAEKLRYVRDLQQRAKRIDERLVQVRVGYAEQEVAQSYIGRGRDLEQHLTRVRIALFVVASDGQKTAWHVYSTGATAGFEAAEIGDEQLHETAETALRLLSAGPIEPGEYDTVTDPSVSGVIAHECFGHGVELDLFPKGRARAAQYLNRRVAAPGVLMFDDPSLPGAYGSYFFDDEGERARPTEILRDGILVRPIGDLASATFAPGEHTPNGRRQDFTRKAYARMTNTFFGAGDTDPAAMIAGVERGVYLRTAESGMEDPLGWGIQVTAHYGEEIVGGRLTGRLFAPVGISGYVPDLLQSISAVGSDFELSPGACGKGHKEFVPVTTGGPHLRMKARLG